MQLRGVDATCHRNVRRRDSSLTSPPYKTQNWRARAEPSVVQNRSRRFCRTHARFERDTSENWRARRNSSLEDEFKDYGQPTSFIFKGRHTDVGKTSSDCVIRFGPGSLLKFGVALDGNGKIASISLG